MSTKKEIIIEQYQNILLTDSVKARKLIQKLDYKNDPYLLQCIAQTYLDESRFDEKGKARAELNWRKWRMAEKYIIKAFEIDSNCLLVLSTMGSLRRSSGQIDIAIYCFEKIIKIGVKGRVSAYYNFDLDFAKELVNDSKFDLYRLYFNANKFKSKRYFEAYMKGLEKGVNTIYKPLKRFLLE